MKLTKETRDELLKEHFEEWLQAYKTNDKKLMYAVQLKTKAIHNQKCTCVTNAVMNKLKSFYIKMGLFVS